MTSEEFLFHKEFEIVEFNICLYVNTIKITIYTAREVSCSDEKGSKKVDTICRLLKSHTILTLCLHTT